jgi:Deacetylase PdaC/Protein of unknown function (DUF3298)
MTLLWRFAMTIKKTACLLVLTLFAPSFQPYKSEAAQSGANARSAAQNQTPPQLDSAQANETAVPAPSSFSESFVGTIGKYAVRMKLEREGAKLTGGYFYERGGAFNVFTRRLELEGRIDAGGNVALTETSNDNDNPQKTGEFKGKLDGARVNGEAQLRFSGSWTGKDGKRLPFSLEQLRFDLGGMKIVKKRKKIASKKLNYEIKTETPQLGGASPELSQKFDQAVANLIAAYTSEFKKEVPAAAPGEEASADLIPFLNVSYEIKGADKDFISILFSFESYPGGLHPNYYYEALNYDLNRNARVKLADLFAPNSNYLKVISDYSIREFGKLGVEGDDVNDAAPKIKNYDGWNITPYGLDISFDRAQIVNWASGEFGVVIPYSVLKPIIKPDGLLARFAM